MWTPKRIVMLAASFGLFMGFYFVYAYFLGGIDGLPPLPEHYKPIHHGDQAGRPPSGPLESTADLKLKMAFGEECDEVKNRKFKLEIEPRGIVLAAHDVSIEPDGRAKLTPFSLAIFSKDKGDKRHPEITTIQAKRAYLTFDRPLANVTEMGSRKIIGGELDEDIYIISNRRTPQRDDDISLFTQGPLFYSEARHQIYTDKTVRLIDPDSKPEPMTIVGNGMDIYLRANQDKKRPTGANASAQTARNQSVPDVDRIELRSDVQMDLWIDSRSGLLGAGKTQFGPEKPKSPGKPAGTAAANGKAPELEKSKIVIRTQGPFVYNVQTDLATFETSKIAGPRPDLVVVDRRNDHAGKDDHLECDRLELQFGRKATPTATTGSRGPDGLDIESVRATGKKVRLHSDAEMLDAEGNEFIYDKAKLLTILRGQPRIWAMKEGNEIQAPELHLLDRKGAQQAVARGEGSIRMLDRTTGKRPVEARWTEKFEYSKEGNHDVLILTGDAVFIQDAGAQTLQARVLKVTLEPGKPGGSSSSPKPTQVEAIGRVLASAPDMRVKDTDHLIIWFKEGSPSLAVLPQPPAPGASPLLRPPGQEMPGQGSSGKPKKPIELSARSVQAHVLRIGNANELQELWCQGGVHVFQEPSSDAEKGVEIRGEKLSLKHHIDGNILTVTGESAQVQLDKITILGPEIDIDQMTNTALVNGPGIMRMPSDRGLDGTRTLKPSELTVDWETGMLFDGQEARFRGGIHATQDTGSLKCQELLVNLDRKVSLKDGDRGKQPAKVQKMVCDRRVVVEDVKIENKQMVAYRRIECPLLHIDNDPEDGSSQIVANGPGTIRTWQPGMKGNVLAPSQSPAAATRTTAQPEQELEPKLTLVSFDGNMVAYNKTGIVTFRDKVEVIHLPCHDPGLGIGAGRLPPGSMALECGQLKVLTRKLANGASTHLMEASDKVFVQGERFQGRSDILKYDESKETIILEGTADRFASLYAEKVPGKRGDDLTGRKIAYNRLTGDLYVEKAQSIGISR